MTLRTYWRSKQHGPKFFGWICEAKPFIMDLYLGVVCEGYRCLSAICGWIGIDQATVDQETMLTQHDKKRLAKNGMRVQNYYGRVTYFALLEHDLTIYSYSILSQTISYELVTLNESNSDCYELLKRNKTDTDIPRQNRQEAFNTST